MRSLKCGKIVAMDAFFETDDDVYLTWSVASDDYDDGQQNRIRISLPSSSRSTVGCDDEIVRTPRRIREAVSSTVLPIDTTGQEVIGIDNRARTYANRNGTTTADVDICVGSMDHFLYGVIGNASPLSSRPPFVDHESLLQNLKFGRCANDQLGRFLIKKTNNDKHPPENGDGYRDSTIYYGCGVYGGVQYLLLHDYFDAHEEYHGVDTDNHIVCAGRVALPICEPRVVVA